MMNDMKPVSVEEVLRQGNDGSGRPRTLLYESFEEAGKPRDKPALLWSYGEASYPVRPELTPGIEKMLAEGILTRGPGHYVHHLGGHAQKISLTNE